MGYVAADPAPHLPVGMAGFIAAIPETSRLEQPRASFQSLRYTTARP
jgi:hypothetical protein